ncbi:porin family protein [Hymenobacter cellulosivorans]|uniref:PorT family protein n=1 Tax=Hymenobacter cellulosivorans TaxID=2932249 RepID=A0ABY4FDL1_9BACT|nr:porin family protein [Hymenobacter cellulosivorans]UOQ54615.1 PorT family protein [Hymenobacter cellulosivorans]
MKKTVIVLASLLSVATISASRAQGVRLGLRAGANYSNLAGDVQNESTYNNKIGFLGGVMLNADLSGDGFLSVQPEILFSQKGFENKPTEYKYLLTTQKREGKVNYNYLDVPVLFKINASGLVLEAGPQYSYLISVKDETKVTTTSSINGNSTTSTTNNQKDLSKLNRNELGYVAGIGYQAENGVSLNLRYTGGFSDFVKSDDGSYFNGDLGKARNSAFQLSLGYLLPNK